MFEKIKSFLITFHDSIFGINRDIGKCTKCKFNNEIHCIVGSYYGNKGIKNVCYEGELWEANN